MNKRKTFGILITAAAAAMITAGIFSGEVTEVFNKAIRICLECMGIGWLPW